MQRQQHGQLSMTAAGTCARKRGQTRSYTIRYTLIPKIATAIASYIGPASSVFRRRCERS